MADTDIIELLNGVDLSPRRRGGAAADTVYLDRDGAPTDRFLEALKSQEIATSSFRRSLDNADLLRPQPHARRGCVDADNSSESNSDFSDDSSHAFMGWSDRQSAKEKHLPSRRAARPSSAVSSTDKVTKKLTRRTSENIFNKSRRSGRSGRCADDMVLSEYTVGAIGSAGRTSRDKRRKVRASSASGVRSSTRVSPPRQRQASAEEAPTPNKEWSGDTSSMREKIRTYRLRLAGQLQTIRSLEVKLGEAELDLRAKDASLNETRQRLQALERREKNSFLRGVASDEPEPALIPLATRERDAIRKLKTQIADLQEKVKEGNLKIRQGNERYKIAKTALDRSSSEQDAAKTNAAKLELTLSDTQNALIRSRRECKELSSQVEAFKGQIHARQEAEESLQKELLRAEGTLREIRSENDSYREDLSRQSKELGFLQEGNRRMELELRLLREKDAVHKLEKRALSKVITHSKTTHPPDTHEDGRINCEYDSEEDRRENRKAANVVRSKSALGGMDSVLAWEKDYTRRRQQRLQRDESLSPPRSPPRSTRRNNGKTSSPVRPISGENPSASVPPDRPKHQLNLGDSSRYTENYEHADADGSKLTLDSLANAELIRLKHNRLQQMYARVTKGKGTANVAVA